MAADNRTHRDFDWQVHEAAREAIQLEDIATLRHLIDTRFGVQNERNTICLYPAIGKCSFEMVKMLLDAGVDRDYHTAEHELGPNVSPLGYTVKNIADPELRWKMVKLLMDNGVNPRYENLYRKSALYEAAQLGMCDMVRFLFAAGVDVNYSSDYGKGFSPLHGAIKMLDGEVCVETVKLLIEIGADVNAKGTDLQQTCLHVLSAKKSNSASKVLQLLLDAGAELDSLCGTNSTPLAIAAHSGDCELMRHIIAAGADVNLSHDRYNTSPIVMALAGYRADAIQVVLNILRDGNILGNSLSDAVCEGGGILPVAGDFRNGENIVDVLKLLIAHGAKVHDTGRECNELFQTVLRLGTIEAMHIFFENGVTLDNCGIPHPLHEAATNEMNDDILKYLLNSYRYDIDEIDSSSNIKCTALCTAVNWLNQHNVRLLIEWGADVNIPCLDYGNSNRVVRTSPLFRAYIKGKWRILDVLLCAGAKVNVDSADEIWQSPFDGIFLQRPIHKTRSSIIGEATLLESRRSSNPNYRNILMEQFANLYPELEEQCLAELEALKGLTFYGTCTYYDLLRGRDVTRYMKSSDVVESFESQKVDDECFPVYGNRLKICYSLAQVRRELVDQVMKVLQEVFLFYFGNNHEILFTIISHLGLKDLRKLCNV